MQKQNKIYKQHFQNVKEKSRGGRGRNASKMRQWSHRASFSVHLGCLHFEWSYIKKKTTTQYLPPQLHGASFSGVRFLQSGVLIF